MKIRKVLVAVFLAVTGASAAEPVSPTVILAEMTRRYATCRSYRDLGVVQILVNGAPLDYPKPFKTYFLRPDYFRFEWTDTIDQPEDKTDGTLIFRRLSGTCLIWCTPTGVREFYDSTVSMDGGAVKPVSDLEMAVAGATGVSLGAAQTVPTLLSPRIHQFRLTELKSLRRLPDIQLNGVTCYHITGRRVEFSDTYELGNALDNKGNAGRGHVEFSDTYELWISQSDFLLRKLRTDGDSPNGCVEEIHRDIRINADIPLKTFRFTPHK